MSSEWSPELTGNTCLSAINCITLSERECTFHSDPPVQCMLGEVSSLLHNSQSNYNLTHVKDVDGGAMRYGAM